MFLFWGNLLQFGFIAFQFLISLNVGGNIAHVSSFKTRNTMFSFFTQNLDTMKEATTKKGKGLSNLENVNRIPKKQFEKVFWRI